MQIFIEKIIQPVRGCIIKEEGREDIITANSPDAVEGLFAAIQFYLNFRFMLTMSEVSCVDLT